MKTGRLSLTIALITMLAHSPVGWAKKDRPVKPGKPDKQQGINSKPDKDPVNPIRDKDGRLVNPLDPKSDRLGGRDKNGTGKDRGTRPPRRDVAPPPPPPPPPDSKLVIKKPKSDGDSGLSKLPPRELDTAAVGLSQYKSS
ncbi:MAG: hypothetical protein AAF492_29195, partial [Verrucomicrobiota bacterium]